MVKKLLEVFKKKKMQKTSDKWYVKWKRYDSHFNNWTDQTDLI